MDSDYALEVGKRIMAARKQKGISQLELAEAVRVDRSRVYTWECGQNMPHARAIAQMCRTLIVSADWLLDVEE